MYVIVVVQSVVLSEFTGKSGKNA